MLPQSKKLELRDFNFNANKMVAKCDFWQVTGCDRFREKMEVFMAEDKNLVIVDNKEIQSMIYTFRGK